MNSVNQITTYNTNSLWVEKLNQIKEIYGKNLTKGEFETFIEIGKATKLNPFLREIWAVKYKDSVAAQIFIGRDGYRKSGQANPNYDYHHVDAVYDNDDFNFDFDSGKIHHKRDFKNRGNLLGAYCLVKRRNSTKPIFVFVDFNEYNTNLSLWKSKPITMIKKVAEAQGFRMAFQELFSGTYDESENWIEQSPLKKAIAQKKESLVIIEQEPIKNNNLDEILLEISQADNIKDLHEIYTKNYKVFVANRDKESIKKLVDAKDKRKNEIEETINDFLPEENINE